MADAASAPEPEGHADTGPETAAPAEPLVARTTVDALLGVWGALYALYAVHQLIRLWARFAVVRPGEVVFGVLFAAALAASLFAAATDRLPAAGYLLVGAVEVYACLGLLRGWVGLSFRAGAADAATSGLLLANLAVATILLARGVRRVRAGEPIVPPTLRETGVPSPFHGE